MPVYHVKVYACLNFVIKGKNYDLACICIAFEKGVCKTCFRLYVQQLNQGFNWYWVSSKANIQKRNDKYILKEINDKKGLRNADFEFHSKLKLM